MQAEKEKIIPLAFLSFRGIIGHEKRDNGSATECRGGAFQAFQDAGIRLWAFGSRLQGWQSTPQGKRFNVRIVLRFERYVFLSGCEKSTRPSSGKPFQSALGGCHDGTYFPQGEKGSVLPLARFWRYPKCGTPFHAREDREKPSASVILDSDTRKRDGERISESG